MSRTVIGGRPASGAPLSPAVRHENVVYLSGQTAGEIAGIEAQTRAVLEKMGRLLREAGSDYPHVLRCGVYLRNIGDWKAMNEVYREFFPADPPARSTIEARLAADSILVEIDCVAAVPRE